MPFKSWATIFWMQCVGFGMLGALCLGLYLYTHALICAGMMAVDYGLFLWCNHIHKEFKGWSPYDSSN